MVSRVIPVDAFDLVIFGGTGDLAKRKILPGLYRRFLGGQMPEDSRIIGGARAEPDDDKAFRDAWWRRRLTNSCRRTVRTPRSIAAFLEQVSLCLDRRQGARAAGKS